jgi:hypothetical protein
MRTGRKMRAEVDRRLSRTASELNALPPGLTSEQLDTPYVRRLSADYELGHSARRQADEMVQKAKREVASRFHGYGMCGGATPSEAQAEWDALPPPPKGARETEEAYQSRLLRIKQQNERFAREGITPSQRSGAIASSARLRDLEQKKAVLAREAVQRAYDTDPEIIAKREAIARKETENAIFNPLLRGAIELGKNIGSLPGVSTLVGKVASTTATALGEQMDAEALQRQQRLEQRAERERATEGSRSDLDRQLAEAKAVPDLERQIAMERTASTLPRFGASRYFG